MEQLAKLTAELALRLAALPAGGPRNDPRLLDAIEHLATRVLKEVADLRVGARRPIGETSGMWPAMQPLKR